MVNTVDVEDKVKDRGWAWVVAIACLVGNFFLIGFAKSFGMFFVEFLELFDGTSSATSLIFGVQGVSFSVSSLFVMTVLIERLSCRLMVIIGGVGFGVGVILASQATTLLEAVIYFGVITGVSNSFTTGPFMVILGQYFNKRHAVACGIAVCGGSLGQFVIPPLLGLCIDVYGFRGAVLIFGGLTLNCVVCGALMRPVPEARKKRRNPAKENKGGHSKRFVDVKSISSEKEAMLDARQNHVHQTEEYCDDEKLHLSQICNGRNTGGSCDTTPDRCSDNLCWTDAQYMEVTSTQPPLHLSSGNLFSSVEIFAQSQTLSKSGDKSLSEKDAACDMLSMCRCCNKIAVYCSMLRNPLFLLILFSLLFGYVGVVTQVVFIPPHAKDVGLSHERIPLLISIMGGFDLVGRILIGLIADTKLVASYHILAFGFLALGVTALLTFLAKTFWGFVAVSISYGIAGGTMYALVPVVVVDLFGLEKLPGALGVIFLFQGSALCSANPLLGWLRDITGNYVTSFYVIGGFLMTAGISLLFVPCFRSWRVAKEENITILVTDSVENTPVKS